MASYSPKRAKQSRAIDQDALIAAIDAAATRAYGSDTDSTLADERSKALDRYFGTNFNPAPDGRSQVRDRTTYETVEWIKPSLLRIYAGSDEVVKFDPQGPEDEEQAEQESDYVNYVVTQLNPWHQICHDWFTDALILKNGYALPYWDTTVQTESEFYENLSDDSYALLVNDPEIEVVAHTEEVDTEAAQAVQQQYMMMAQQAMMQGQLPPPPPPEPKLHTLEIKRTNKRGRVCIHVLAPERTLVSVDTPNFTLDDCDYFEYFDFRTIGQLRAAGLEVDDDIADEQETRTYGTEENSRDLYSEQSNLLRSGDRKDPASRVVKIRYIWIRYDANEDGINELQYVIRIGDKVLFREECDEIPVASITPTPLPHRHIGMSVADVVEDIEDVNTAFTRQAIDNLFYSNNPRLAVSDQVNMADLLDSRPGGVIRVDGQPPQEIMPVVVPDMFPAAIQALQFFDSRRMNRTGINAYFQGTDANTLNKTASGIAQLTSSAGQRVELIARLFSSGVTKLFHQVHKLILKHGHQKEVVRLRGKWAVVDPSEWKRRTNLKLAVGLGTGTKEGLLQNLANVFAAQLQTIPLGIVQPPNIYRTAVEMTKAAGFSNAEAFWTDPATQPPQPQQPPPEVQAEQMKSQTQLQMKQADAQINAQTQQLRVEFDRWKAEQEFALKKYEIELNAQVKLQTEALKAENAKEVKAMDQPDPVKEAEEEMLNKDMAATVKAMGDMQQAQMQTMQQLAEAMTQAAQAMLQAAQAQAAPLTVIRDKMGRVVGAQRGQATQTVQ